MIVISRDMVVGAVEDDLRNPRIGIDNLLAEGVIAATSEQAEFEKENAVDGNTYDYWRPTALPARLSVTLPSGREANYMGIAAHTIGAVGATVTAQYWDGSGWVSAHEPFTPIFSPIVGSPQPVIIVLFNAQYSNQWSILIEGAGGMPSIGVAHIGKMTVLERKFYQGHSPINLSRRTDIRHNVSDGGLDLGRAFMKQGAATSVQINNLSPAFVRGPFTQFTRKARTKAFFWSWNPLKFPNDTAFCWTDDEIVSTNSGPRDLISTSINLQGMIE